jgi:hypothetical protein
MIALADLRTAAPADLADSLSYTVFALVRICRIALENDTSGEANREADVAAVLELTEAIASIVIDGTETLSREAKRGIWAA